MTETKTGDENKSSSMANKENGKYKTVGCQVSSGCEEMKYLKEQIESLTMILFLSRELEPLIYWPTVEQTLAYNSKHF